MKTPIPTATVHANGNGSNSSEAFEAEVFACLHSPNYAGERNELLLLGTQEWISLEEGNYFVKEIGSSSDYKHHRAVLRSAVILPYRPTVHPLPDQIENLCTAYVLTDTKFGNKLPTGSRPRISLDRHVKAAFSVNESRYVSIQPFLLIDRTCRIVTFSYAHGRQRYDSHVTAMAFGDE